jgi:hypothetical protein
MLHDDRGEGIVRLAGVIEPADTLRPEHELQRVTGLQAGRELRGENLASRQAHALPPRSGCFDAGRDEIGLAHEAGDEVVGRLVVDRAWTVELLDPAVAHHGDPIREEKRFLLIMRHENGRQAQALLEPPQLDLHGLPELAVKCAEGLVEQQQARVEHDRARQGDTLLLTSRQFARQAFAISAEFDERQGLFNPPPDLGPRDAAHLERECDIAGDRQMREQGIVLEHHADVSPSRRRVRDILAPEHDLPRVDVLEARDGLQQGRLPRAAGPEQRDELARGDRQADSVQSEHAAVALACLPDHEDLGAIAADLSRHSTALQDYRRAICRSSAV